MTKVGRRLLAALMALPPTVALAKPLPLGCDTPTMQQIVADVVSDLKGCEAPGDGRVAEEHY